MVSFITAQTEKNLWKTFVKTSDEFVKRCHKLQKYNINNQSTLLVQIFRQQKN